MFTFTLSFYCARGKCISTDKIEQIQEYPNCCNQIDDCYISLQNSPDPILRGVLERLIKPDYDKLPTNDAEGLRRICDSNNYAFLTSLFFVRQCYGEYHCSVVEVPDASFHAPSSIIMTKESNYKRLFAHR
jgi:hypothetical protein